MRINAVRLLVALALSVCVLSPAVSAINQGQPPSCGDRRFDCVGFLRAATNCYDSSSVRGSCVLIDQGQRAADGTLIRGARVLCAAHEVDYKCTITLASNFRVRFRRSVTGDVNGHFGGRDDCNGAYQEYRVVSAECPPGSVTGIDQMILTLESDVPTIQPATMDFSLTTGVQAPGFIAGWGYVSSDPSSDRWTLRFKPVPITANIPMISASGGLLHDSGGGIFVEVPNPAAPGAQPDVRLVGLLTSTIGGRNFSAWTGALDGTRLADVPAPAAVPPADFNQVNGVSVQDLFDYLNAWTAGRCEADINEVDGVTVQDLFDFMNAWLGSSQ